MAAFSENVESLLRRIGGVEELEVLLLLARTPDRYFSAAQVTAALHLVRSLQPALERLAHENLIDVTLGTDVLYRFLGGEETTQVVAQIASAYEHQRLAVIAVLLEKTPAHDFAEAFRIRKRRSDG